MQKVTEINKCYSNKDLMYNDSIISIVDTLKSINKQYIRHYFTSIFGKGCNIIVEINNDAKEDILVTAHYDGVGIFDNHGGVLLMLGILEHFKSRNNYNYKFVFTDKEESFQQGIKYFLKDYYFNKLHSIKYHLNIDGIGIGESIIIYPSKLFYINRWVHNKPTLLLTDCSPLTQSNLNTYHMFSCFTNDAEKIVESQLLPDSLSKYLNDKWCVENFKEGNISTSIKKTLMILANIENVFSKSAYEHY